MQVYTLSALLYSLYHVLPPWRARLQISSDVFGFLVLLVFSPPVAVSCSYTWRVMNRRRSVIGRLATARRSHDVTLLVLEMTT